MLLVGGSSSRGELRVLQYQVGVILRVLAEGGTGEVRVEEVLLLLLLIGLLVVAWGGGCRV